MTLSKRTSVFLTILTVVLSYSFLAASPPAFADRCQPEELIGQPGIIPENANPVCLVMDEVTYPLLGCPLPTTLATCRDKVIAAFTSDPVAASRALAANAQQIDDYAQSTAAKAPQTADNLVVFGQTTAGPFIAFVKDILTTRGRVIVCSLMSSGCTLYDQVVPGQGSTAT